MTSKVVLVCVSALFVQHISGLCTGNPWLADAGYLGGLNYANTANNLALADDIYALAGGYGTSLPCGGYGTLAAGDLSSLALGGFNSAAAPYGGGPFGVTSASLIAPNGISAIADNLVYEGPLSVSGNMPFLGTASFDGALPAGGLATVSYGAGDGGLGITSERPGSAVNAAAASAATSGGLDYGFGLGYGLGGAGLAAAELGYATGLGNRFAGGLGCGYGAGMGIFGRGYGLGPGNLAPGGCTCGL